MSTANAFSYKIFVVIHRQQVVAYHRATNLGTIALFIVMRDQIACAFGTETFRRTWKIEPSWGWRELRSELGACVLIGFYADQASADGRMELKLLEEAGCRRIFGPHALISEDVIEYLRASDTLIVVKLARLAKTLPGLILLVERLQAAGVTVHAIEDQVVPGTAVGDAFGQACSLLSAFHRSVASGDAKEKKGRRGRPIVLAPDDQVRAERLLKRASVIEVARLMKVSPATLYRYFPRREFGPAAYGSDRVDRSRRSVSESLVFAPIK